MHAMAIVLVNPTEDVRAEVDRLLAPFSENGEAAAACFDAEGNETAEYEPGRFWWDWWRLGGRFDGAVRGLMGDTAPGCQCQRTGERSWSLMGASGKCHYSSVHESIERNVVPVIEMGECRPYTLVTPEGEVRHRQHWVTDPTAGDTGYPWDLVDDETYDRWCGEQLLAHRDCWAVGIDYHD